jgi:chromosome segregation ATPase
MNAADSRESQRSTKSGDIIQQLQDKNKELRAQLNDLNAQLDEMLTQRGEKISRVHRHQQFAVKGENKEMDALMKEIETLRKENTELRQKVYNTDVQSRISELLNLIREREKSIETLKEENRSLENVQKHQGKQLQELDKLESDMRDARAKHADDVRILKDRTRQMKQERDETERQAKIQQTKLTQLQEKIKAANAIQIGANTVDQLQTAVTEKEKEMEILKYQIASLSESTEAEKAKSRAIARQAHKEAQELRDELQRLQEILLEKEKEMKLSYVPRAQVRTTHPR